MQVVEGRDTEVSVGTSIADRAPAWDALVDSMEIPSPFLRSWWLDATVQGTPCFVFVLRGDVLVGGLALQADRHHGVSRLRHAGTGPLKPDHLDCVSAPGESDAVVAALRSWFRRPGSRLIDLAGIGAAGAVRGALPRPVREHFEAGAPWTQLPASYEVYAAARPPGLRKSIRKTERRLAAEGVQHRVVGAEGFAGALADLRRLHELQFDNTSGFLPGFDEFRHAVLAGASTGEIVFHELATDDRVIAVEVFFLTGGLASFYQIGRDPDPRWDGSGTLLKARAIEWFCARGLTHLDLLRDDVAHKHRWAEDVRVMVRLEAASGLRARILWTLAPSARRLRAIALRARQRLGRLRRRLLRRADVHG